MGVPSGFGRLAALPGVRRGPVVVTSIYDSLQLERHESTFFRVEFLHKGWTEHAVSEIRDRQLTISPLTLLGRGLGNVGFRNLAYDSVSPIILIQYRPRGICGKIIMPVATEKSLDGVSAGSATAGSLRISPVFGRYLRMQTRSMHLACKRSCWSPATLVDIDNASLEALGVPENDYC